VAGSLGIEVDFTSSKKSGNTVAIPSDTDERLRKTLHVIMSIVQTYKHWVPPSKPEVLNEKAHAAWKRIYFHMLEDLKSLEGDLQTALDKAADALERSLKLESQLSEEKTAHVRVCQSLVGFIQPCDNGEGRNKVMQKNHLSESDATIDSLKKFAGSMKDSCDRFTAANRKQENLISELQREALDRQDQMVQLLNQRDDLQEENRTLRTEQDMAAICKEKEEKRLHDQNIEFRDLRSQCQRLTDENIRIAREKRIADDRIAALEAQVKDMAHQHGQALAERDAEQGRQIDELKRQQDTEKQYRDDLMGFICAYMMRLWEIANDQCMAPDGTQFEEDLRSINDMHIALHRKFAMWNNRVAADPQKKSEAQKIAHWRDALVPGTTADWYDDKKLGDIEVRYSEMTEVALDKRLNDFLEEPTPDLHALQGEAGNVAHDESEEDEDEY
jgi:hypothetical protein